MDNEVAGTGNQYDYGFRIYNPRLGRFLSVDPLTKSYPWYTPYQFAGNKPINSIDLDGMEELDVIINETNNVRTTYIKVTNSAKVKLKVTYMVNDKKAVVENDYRTEDPLHKYYGDRMVDMQRHPEKYPNYYKMRDGTIKSTEVTYTTQLEPPSPPTNGPPPPHDPPSPVVADLNMTGTKIVNDENEPISIGWVDWSNEGERKNMVDRMVEIVDGQVSNLNGELQSITIDSFVGGDFITESENALKKKYNITDVKINHIKEGDRGENNSSVLTNAKVKYISKE